MRPKTYSHVRKTATIERKRTKVVKFWVSQPSRMSTNSSTNRFRDQLTENPSQQQVVQRGWRNIEESVVSMEWDWERIATNDKKLHTDIPTSNDKPLLFHQLHFSRVMSAMKVDDFLVDSPGATSRASALDTKSTTCQLPLRDLRWRRILRRLRESSRTRWILQTSRFTWRMWVAPGHWNFVRNEEQFLWLFGWWMCYSARFLRSYTSTQHWQVSFRGLFSNLNRCQLIKTSTMYQIWIRSIHWMIVNCSCWPSFRLFRR